ncbi:sushi domain-containing protein 2-like [Acanthaster planci]|uniref:Sushi domain-containing protein 2-like n=1 Tax=Acanthaster planci TaxID=133434 RepID=A0A8B7Y6W0_ACAPL|nr:sushi domain-containing protein 2-like [Acanthaster planci]
MYLGRSVSSRMESTMLGTNLFKRVDVGLFLIGCLIAVTNGNELLFPFGAEEGDVFLAPNDDGSSGEIPISIPFPFFDHNHDTLFVNTNGVISFLIQVSQFTPSPFPLDGDRRVVAAFWGDVDIRFGGNVAHRELHRTPSNEQLFNKADSIIRRGFIDQSKFSASWMFITTWHEVPFYGALAEALDITNTFQALLVTNGRHSFAVYNYDEIRWTTGTASGGDSSNGLGGTPAQVGFNAGDGFTFYAVPKSRTDEIVDIDEDSNVGTTGRFLFRIDSGDIVDSGCNSEGSLAVFPVSASMLGGDIVHISGPCLDASSNIVCRFAGVEVPGEVISNTTARCVSPLVFEVGRLPLEMSTDGGEFFNFTGLFTYLSPEDTTPLVKQQDAADWLNQEVLTVTWNTELLQGYVDDVRVSVYAYEENLLTGELKFPFVYALYGVAEEQSVPYSAGQFSFIRPRAPNGAQYTVGAIRVSQYVGQDEVAKNLPGMWSDIHNLHWLYPVPDPSAWCGNWLEEAQLDLEFLAVTEPCPCTLTQALVDTGRFSDHPLCNSPESCEVSKPGAVHCVRVDTASELGSGQECCYGNDNNILDVLKSTGGGFAQRRHHGGVAPYKVAGRVPYLSHWLADILPLEHCCMFSELFCRMYKLMRPSQTCENYEPPRPAIGTGDPHLFTLDRIEYTFNGVGEYTLLETCDSMLELQARMAVLQPGQNATVITALAAVHRNESDQVHIEVSERRGIDVWFRSRGNESGWSIVDFEETQIRRAELEGVTVLYREVNNSGVMAKNIHVNFKCGVSLVVSTASGLLNVFTALQEKLKGRTRGLYGNWNGDKNDDFERPNGTMLPISATAEEIHYKFCQKWQIEQEDSLFRYPAGKGPSDYRDESFIPVFWSESDPIDENVLEICGNDTRCAFDYAVTGDENIARATRGAVASYKTAIESAELVICGTLDVPPNGRKEVSRSSVGGEAVFSCDKGYTLQGESELVCQEDGQWSGKVPTCRSTAKSPSDPGLEKWQLALIIVVSSLVLILGVTGIFVAVKKIRPKVDVVQEIHLNS